MRWVTALGHRRRWVTDGVGSQTALGGPAAGRNLGALALSFLSSLPLPLSSLRPSLSSLPSPLPLPRRRRRRRFAAEEIFFWRWVVNGRRRVRQTRRWVVGRVGAWALGGVGSLYGALGGRRQAQGRGRWVEGRVGAGALGPAAATRSDREVSGSAIELYDVVWQAPRLAWRSSGGHKECLV